MFRSLVFHKYKNYNIEQPVKEALEHWTHGIISRKDFIGVKLEEIPKFEEVFNINVNIYSLDEEDKATVIYKSAGLYEDTLYLDKYLNHVSYINNFKAYMIINFRVENVSDSLIELIVVTDMNLHVMTLLE